MKSNHSTKGKDLEEQEEEQKKIEEERKSHLSRNFIQINKKIIPIIFWRWRVLT